MNHPAGSFCFAELHTPVPEQMTAFYRDMLGWTARPISHDFWTFAVGNADDAGMRCRDDHRWVPCVRVDDIMAMLLRAKGEGLVAGGPPVETPGVARTALLRDPEGAVLALWQPDGLEGTSLERGPGSLWWVELATADMQGARARYSSIFGWRTDHTMKFDNGPHGYTLFKVGERSAAGAFQFEADWGIDAAWQVYFEVSDFDAAAARACELGGQVTFVRDAPHAGRIGVQLDPGGALFCLAQPMTPAAI
jgi:predicted enzyme related to lactoylglutathione lyase